MSSLDNSASKSLQAFISDTPTHSAEIIKYQGRGPSYAILGVLRYDEWLSD